MKLHLAWNRCDMKHATRERRRINGDHAAPAVAERERRLRRIRYFLRACNLKARRLSSAASARTPTKLSRFCSSNSITTITTTMQAPRQASHKQSYCEPARVCRLLTDHAESHSPSNATLHCPTPRTWELMRTSSTLVDIPTASTPPVFAHILHYMLAIGGVPHCVTSNQMVSAPTSNHHA